MNKLLLPFKPNPKTLAGQFPKRQAVALCTTGRHERKEKPKQQKKTIYSKSPT